MRTWQRIVTGWVLGCGVIVFGIWHRWPDWAMVILVLVLAVGMARLEWRLQHEDYARKPRKKAGAATEAVSYDWPPPVPDDRKWWTDGLLNGQAYIRCGICARTSWNPHDVRYHFCGHCDAYLQNVKETYEFAQTLPEEDGRKVLEDSHVIQFLPLVHLRFSGRK